MNKMKMFIKLNLALLMVGIFIISSCKKDKDTIVETDTVNTVKTDTVKVTPPPGPTQKNIIISGTIWGKKTLVKNSDSIYWLDGFVYVKDGGEINIQPGVVIKTVAGSKAALVIERGGKIYAKGNSSAPIVFTSGKAAGSRNYGDWGGLVICGKAKTNKHDAGTGVGISEGGIGSLYGGTVDTDSSGILEYVRIEFAGIALTSTSNSEINGLTLYSVGSKTVINHIQVSYSGDDSYEWFGGTVNCKHLVAFRGWDDDFDTDNGYTGNVQFAVALRDSANADQSSSNGFESDNDADGSTLTPITKPIFSNISIFGPKAFANTKGNVKYATAMHLRRGTRICIFNSVFLGYPKGLLIDGEKGDSPTQADADELQIKSSVIALMTSNYAEKTGTVAVTYTTAQVQTYYEASAKNNSALADYSTLNISNGFKYTAPDFRPTSGSVLLTGADFTYPNLASSFFTVVTYKGAFDGTTDWTSGWCNWNPQNTAY